MQKFYREIIRRFLFRSEGKRKDEVSSSKHGEANEVLRVNIDANPLKFETLRTRIQRPDHLLLVKQII